MSASCRPGRSAVGRAPSLGGAGARTFPREGAVVVIVD